MRRGAGREPTLGSIDTRRGTGHDGGIASDGDLRVENIQPIRAQLRKAFREVGAFCRGHHLDHGLGIAPFVRLLKVAEDLRDARIVRRRRGRRIGTDSNCACSLVDRSFAAATC